MTSKPWASGDLRRGVVARVVDEQRAVGGVDGDLGRHLGDRARGLVGRQDKGDDGGAATVAQQRLRRALDVDAVGHDHALVVERQAQRGAGGERVGQALERRAGGPEAFGQARRPAPDGERAHQRHVGGDDQAAGGEQLAQRRPRQQARVGGHEAPPPPSGDARGHRRGIGRDHAQHAPGAQQPGAAVDRGHGVVEVLDHVGEHDDVEAVEIDEGLNGLLAHVEPQHLAGVARGRARELEPDRLVAAGARLVEQQAMPAADVEQAPRRRPGRRRGRAGGRRSRGARPPRRGRRRRSCRDRARAARRRPAAAAAARCRTRRTSAGRRGGRSRGARARRRRPPGRARWCRRCAG